jgi:plastocyanin
MKVLAMFAVLALLAGAGCSDSSGPGGQNVSISDNSFSPSTLTVTTGATVTWTWNGSNSHNVTWVNGSPAASPTQSSGSYQRTFDAPGTYTYYCTIHGTPTSGMRGTVVVQ